jgi:hypothetical protein
MRETLKIVVFDDETVRVFMDGHEVKGWRLIEFSKDMESAAIHAIEFVSSKGGIKE